MLKDFQFLSDAEKAEEARAKRSKKSSAQEWKAPHDMCTRARALHSFVAGYQISLLRPLAECGRRPGLPWA